MRSPRHLLSLALLLVTLLLAALAPATAQERRNWFDDPFAQATRGLPGCPLPLGPLLTTHEMRTQAHQRAERGTRCWQEGRCASPNAYADDAAINTAAVRALRAAPQFAGTQLWLTTQRRFVFVQGCVRDRAQIARVIALLRSVPQVEYVGDELMVGTNGKPPYETTPPPAR